MSDNTVVVASAVVLPEETNSPTLSIKRKLSSGSVEDSKKQRVVQDTISEGKDEAAPQMSRSVGQRTSREIDERKRGKRLFGALLGTLGQNSSSTAQKRRADIEKKQREKLKLQAEEDDENKRQRLNAILENRRREQELWDKRSAVIKHSSMLAEARFLRTKTEPILLYKPWELRVEEENIIKAQISDAEQSIAREKEETNGTKLKQEPGSDESQANTLEDTPGSTNYRTVGDTANEVDQLGMTVDKTVDLVPNSNGKETSPIVEAPKDAMDDDMVEGEEDAVIY